MEKAITASSNSDSIQWFIPNKIRSDRSSIGSEWEKLPSDLLLKIQEKLNAYDKIRVYCVCKTWQSVMSKSCLSQPVPFLLLPPQLYDEPYRFYDIVDKKSYSLNLFKKTEGKPLCFQGSSYGWLVAVIDLYSRMSQRHLINPLTGSRKQLPDVTWQGHSTDKYILSSNPGLSDDYFVVAIYGQPSRLAYTRHIDDTWTNVESTKCFLDVTFYEGELYGLTENLEMTHIKISPHGSQVTQINKPVNVYWHSSHTYLVESCIGLLMVGQYIRRMRETRCYTEQTEKTNRCDVYKFDFELGQWSDRLRDIGENVLFVGRMGSMSVSASDSPRGDSNSIYFMDNCVSYLSNISMGKGWLHMGVFDLKTRTFEHSVAKFEYGLPLVWPCPLWVTPQLILS